MLLFEEKIQLIDPFNVIFLCGSHFKKNDLNDKRVILKQFLINCELNCQVVILEENFTFANKNSKLLFYDNIFLSNLSQVENLAALFADKIIVIHESFSTAAEIGMFASNTALTSKVAIIYPEPIAIEEDKISGFMKLAFFRVKDNGEKPTRIKYYPDIEIQSSSEYISKYYISFPDNTIGTNLGESIISFVVGKNISRNIEFLSAKYGNKFNDTNIISYFISDNEVKVYISATALRLQLLAMVTLEQVINELNKEKTLSKHISFFENTYKRILLDTVCNIEGLSSEKCTIKVELFKGNDCELRQAIGYFVYMLQAIGFIQMEKTSADNAKDDKIIIKTTSLKGFKIEDCRKYIYEKSETEYGRMMS